MISYEKALKALAEKGFTATKIKKDCILAQATMTSMRRNGYVTTRVIERLCEMLQCQPGDLMEYIPDEK